SLLGYNGANGTLYSTVALSGTIPNQQGCAGTLSFAFVGLQNGSPDGLALVNPDNEVIEFISYEGSFAAAQGPASGRTSVDIGVSETSNTPIGQSLGLAGTGGSRAGFTWSAPGAQSPGSPNVGQTFNACTVQAVPALGANGLPFGMSVTLAALG